MGSARARIPRSSRIRYQKEWDKMSRKEHKRYGTERSYIALRAMQEREVTLKQAKRYAGERSEEALKVSEAIQASGITGFETRETTHKINVALQKPKPTKTFYSDSTAEDVIKAQRAGFNVQVYDKPESAVKLQKSFGAGLTALGGFSTSFGLYFAKDPTKEKIQESQYQSQANPFNQTIPIHDEAINGKDYKRFSTWRDTTTKEKLLMLHPATAGVTTSKIFREGASPLIKKFKGTLLKKRAEGYGSDSLLGKIKGYGYGISVKGIEVIQFAGEHPYITAGIVLAPKGLGKVAGWVTPKATGIVSGFAAKPLVSKALKAGAFSIYPTFTAATAPEGEKLISGLEAAGLQLVAIGAYKGVKKISKIREAKSIKITEVSAKEIGDTVRLNLRQGSLAKTDIQFKVGIKGKSGKVIYKGTGTEYDLSKSVLTESGKKSGELVIGAGKFQMQRVGSKQVYTGGTAFKGQLQTTKTGYVLGKGEYGSFVDVGKIKYAKGGTLRSVSKSKPVFEIKYPEATERRWPVIGETKVSWKQTIKPSKVATQSFKPVQQDVYHSWVRQKPLKVTTKEGLSLDYFEYKTKRKGGEVFSKELNQAWNKFKGERVQVTEKLTPSAIKKANKPLFFFPDLTIGLTLMPVSI